MSSVITFESEADFLAYIDSTLSQWNKNEITIICAGHFMLLPDKSKDKVIPGIFEKEVDPYFLNAQSAIGIFPQYTWKLGCRIMSRLVDQGKVGKLSLLVNDWQLVPPDRHREEDKPNRFRSMFYKEFRSLPEQYREEFELNHLNFERDMYRTSDGDFFLREVRLRGRFVRRMKKMIAGEDSVAIGMCSLNLDEFGNISMDQGNKKCYPLTIRSKAGCAGGVAQMILDIANGLNGIFKKINFVNLMPSGCTNPVNIASELALEILRSESGQLSISILDVYLNGHGAQNESDFYDSYGREVVCYQFNSIHHV